MKVTLLVPTLNEEEGIRRIMPMIDKSWLDQILVIDGNSQDKTVEECEKLGLEVIQQSRPGLRYAYMEALPHIKGDVVITFSPDGNCLPELIPQLIEEMKKGHDMVIVSRYKDHATSEDDDVITGPGNWFFTKTVNLLHGGNYTDVMGIFRAYKTKLIYDLDLDKAESYSLPERLFFTRLSWEPLLSTRAAKAKLKIGEIPGDEPARIGGDRKLQIIRWGAGYYFQFLYEVFFWRKSSKLALE
jgi:glycosyltransferase involved in cell wall biosynthesis